MSQLTTRRAAQALGVSESSLKRWCDQGVLETIRTAGGHRRVEASAVIAYARDSGRQLVKPQLLGLLPRKRPNAERVEASAAAFFKALLAGDEVGCRYIAQTFQLAGGRVAAFADQFISPAFRDIGEHWSHGEVEIYQERRACQICQSILAELNSSLPQPAAKAPVAIGGTPECDPYTHSTNLASLVLRQHGWRAQSLGSGLPWDTLAAAIRDLKPRLFWLSVSAVGEAKEFLAGYAKFYAKIGDSTAVVVGGRGLVPDIRSQMKYASYCDNLTHLEAFSETLRRSERPARRAGV